MDKDTTKLLHTLEKIKLLINEFPEQKHRSLCDFDYTNHPKICNCGALEANGIIDDIKRELGVTKVYITPIEETEKETLHRHSLGGLLPSHIPYKNAATLLEELFKNE